eukprot:4744213-Prymnesium_polylepis.1
MGRGREPSAESSCSSAPSSSASLACRRPPSVPFAIHTPHALGHAARATAPSGRSHSWTTLLHATAASEQPTSSATAL